MQFQWICHPSDTLPPFSMPWRGANHTREDENPRGEGLPCFRKQLFFRERPQSLVAYVTALGVFELFWNGERVGEVCPLGTFYDELKPGATDYRRRVHAFSYDLMPYIQGENKVVAVVSPGWWSGRISFGAFGLSNPAFSMILRVTYADGKVEEILTDDTWETTIAGPTLFADLYDGEYTDARMPPPWGMFDCYPWVKAERTTYEGVVEPLKGPPVRIRHDLTLHPVSCILANGVEQTGSTFGSLKCRWKRVGAGCEKSTLLPGETLIVDMGQNMVGKPLVQMQAKAGGKIKIVVGEMLNDSGEASRGNDGPKGSLYVANYRSAKSHMIYIACGSIGETYSPMFTYYGYRYLEITCDAPLTILGIQGLVMTSLMEEVGEIETDNPHINRLIANIQWGRRGNYLSTATDCPQRDERIGWSCDTHIFAYAGAYLADIRSFMDKYLEDARDSQETHDGAYGDVIPTVLSPVGDSFFGNAGWGDAGIILPRVLWEMYGERESLRIHYPSMERYMQYLAQFGYEGGGLNYGDWLAYEPTDKRYIAVCYYAYDAALMRLHSLALSDDPLDFYGKRAVYYRELFDNIRAYFRQRYIRDGMVSEDTQTGILLALRFGLLEEAEILPHKERLLHKLRENGYRLSTGFLGTGVLAPTLADLGENNMVYSLLLGEEDPSWLYSVKQGATTMWERWNSYTREKGFGDVSMNSFNHYAYGAVLEWMFRSMAGIGTDLEKVGFEHIILAPHPDTRGEKERPAGQQPIHHVQASYRSIRGRISSEWYLQDGAFLWRFTIPNGVSATIRCPLIRDGKPTEERDSITINGVPYTVGELCGTKCGCTLEFTLTGGTYEIR